MACRQLGIKLIHLSTDYVFDGTKPGPYVEWDGTEPLSVYGRSKLLGEEWVRQQCPDHFVVRPRPGSIGLPRPQFRHRHSGPGPEWGPDGELKVVSDQRGTPTSALALAPRLPGPGLDRGLRHLSCDLPGETTWYEFAGLILAAAGITVRLTLCTTAELPFLAVTALRAPLAASLQPGAIASGKSS